MSGLIFLFSIIELLTSIFQLPTLHAAFDEASYGARALALSKTFTARADSPYSIYFNPAALAFLNRLQFASEYKRILPGLSDGSNISGVNAIIALPVNPPMPRPAERKNLFTLGAAYNAFNLTDAYSESVMRFAFAVPFTRDVAAGVTVKSMQQKFQTSGNPYYDADAVFLKDNAASVVDSDFGVFVRPMKNISAGVSISNFLMKKYGISEQVSPENVNRFGIVYEEESLNIAVEVERRTYANGSQSEGTSNGEKIRYAAGIEKSLFGAEDGSHLLALRAGFNWAGALDSKNITAGIGINVGRLEVDYGWSFPLSGVEGTSGNHGLSLIVKFGKMPVRIKPAKKAAAAEQPKAAEIQGTGISTSTMKAYMLTPGEIQMPKNAMPAPSAPPASIVPSTITLQAFRNPPSASGGFGGQAPAGKQFVAQSTMALAAAPVSVQKFKLSGIMMPPATAFAVPAMPTAVGISTLSGPAPLRGTAFPEFQGAPAGEAAPKAPKRRKPSAGHLPEKAGLAAPKVQPLNVPEFTSEPRRIYRVEPGDTLSTIAQRFYGDGKKWVKIYEANKERIEKGIVKPGQRIIIP